MVPGGTGPGVGFIVTGVTGVGMGLVPREGAGSVGLIPRDAAGAPGFKITPVRRISATAFPPAVPLIVSSTGLERVDAFLGMSVTVSFAGLNAAERSLSTGELLAVNDPLLFASANRKVATFSAWAALTGPLKSMTISVTKCLLFSTSWTPTTVAGGVGDGVGADAGVGVGAGDGVGGGVGDGVGVGVGDGDVAWVTTN
jgi:hypothetical protein